MQGVGEKRDKIKKQKYFTKNFMKMLSAVRGTKIDKPVVVAIKSC